MTSGGNRRRSRLLWVGASTLALAAAPALAQETGDAPPPQPTLPAAVEGAKTFLPADFTRFAPRNALDMLRNVPGFTIREATQERGLGTATGNVLINGRRISGKSNDVVTELGQIPAANVIRIEIRDAATLDVPGLSGQVANVVAKAGGIQGQFAWRPRIPPAQRRSAADPRRGLGQRQEGQDRIYARPPEPSFRSGANGRTNIFNAAGDRTEARNDVFTGNGENPKASVKLTWDGPGTSVANFNGSVQGFYYDYRERGERVSPGLADRIRLVANDEDSWSYELGGDYEFALLGGRLKLIGLEQGGHTPFAQDVRTSFADGAPDTGSRFDEIADTHERIGRAEYRWKWGKSDLQLSAEGAFNSLDNVSNFFILRSNGDYEEIPLPGGTATVKEDRYEVMASLGRPLSPKLSIQLAAGGEYSNLRQTGPGGLSRTFWRPKGLFSAAWKASPKLDVNLKLQRRVGQLNFGDFLAKVNLNDDRTNAGNADLVPQQSWEADLEGTRNLGRYGTTTLRLYGRLFEDVVDIIPIGATGESIGNIDSAHSYGVEWKSTFNFDPLGLEGGQARPSGAAPADAREGSADGGGAANLEHPHPLLRHVASPRHPGKRLGLWNEPQPPAQRPQRPADGNRAPVGRPLLGKPLRRA
jgi:hypothetical protein